MIDQYVCNDFTRKYSAIFHAMQKHVAKIKVIAATRDGSGPDLARLETRPKGVSVTLNPSQPIFEGTKLDPRTVFLPRAIFFFLKCLFSSNLCDI